jgi:hypothetical protein
MARTVAVLKDGTRMSDHISLGVIGRAIPVEAVRRVLHETGREGVRSRDLPAHVVVYYAIAMSLFMQVSCREVLRCLLEGASWLAGKGEAVKISTRGGISRARERVGSEPLEALHDEVVRPVAIRCGERETRGAWYRRWRVVSLDGSTLDVADTKENDAEFGRPGSKSGHSAFPQIRFVSLVENGTHVLFGTRMSGCGASEAALAPDVINSLDGNMICLADRGFFSYSLWLQAASRQAALAWRVKTNMLLPCIKRLDDGSYLSEIYPTPKDRRNKNAAIAVRVIEYTIGGLSDNETLYRLITTVLDPQEAPAVELAGLYHERWEIETAFDEFKTHLRGANIILRSKRPDLVRQEFFGLLMAHFAIRGIMHEAALTADLDPDRLSFTHTLRVLRRKIQTTRIPISPSAHEANS